MELLGKITDGTLVLTPNQRLAASMHKLYQRVQLDKGLLCWTTPDILPIKAWLQKLHLQDSNQSASNRPLLLNGIQEQFLWEEIISSTKAGINLLQVSESAGIAISAWKLLKQWRIDIHHPAFQESEDYKIFQQWALQFLAHCHTRHWLDQASLLDLLIDDVRNRKISIPKHIILLGFTELAPQWQIFFDLCSQQDCQIEHYALQKDHKDSVRLSLDDAEDEIRTMAIWAKSIYEKNNQAHIGCVIPNLEKQRDRVMQLFSEVFADQDCYQSDPAKSLFNISAGRNLTQFPLIHTALLALSLYKKNMPADSFRYLLASPFLGEAESEYIKRAHYDDLLRQKNISKLDFSLAEKMMEEACPALAKRIQAFKTLFHEINTPHSYHQWAILFNELLSCLGWPGERSLNSSEYQIVDAWLNLLNHLQSLDQVSGHVNYPSALQTLQTAASKHIFQQKTPDAPIQVLGALEAAGLAFDYLWISGMDNLNWPPQPQANPFLPKSLQHNLNMPHATAERELLYCKQLLDQYQQGATHLIFSHPSKNQDLLLHASALIQDVPKVDISMLDLAAYQSPHQRIYATKQLISQQDDRAPTVIISNEVTKGGVNIIKQQARCPFKAFAEWRLHAHAIDDDLPGLRDKDRGILIHKILELIWNSLHDQATLLSLAEADLTIIIHDCIQQAFKPWLELYANRPQYVKLEHERLHKLIREWLAIEKNRPPFKVIIHENKLRLALNQLQLETRIDRIDELANGQKFIIDYKTSKYPEIHQWLGDRPDEPQLPLYALHDPIKTMGIAFAKITSGDCGFKGISHEAIDIDGIKLIHELKQTETLSWSGQLQLWQQTFNQLSDDFVQGIAHVDPKDLKQSCKNCNLQSLCRIHEEWNLSHDK